MKKSILILLLLPLFTKAQFHVSVGVGHDVSNLYTTGYSAGYQFNKIDVGADFRILTTPDDFKNGGGISYDYNGVRVGYIIGNSIQLTPYMGYYFDHVEKKGFLGYSLKLEKRTQHVASLFIEGSYLKTYQFQIGLDLRSIIK